MAEVLLSAGPVTAIELLAVTSLDAVAGKMLRLEDGRDAEPRPLPYSL